MLEKNSRASFIVVTPFVCCCLGAWTKSFAKDVGVKDNVLSVFQNYYCKVCAYSGG